MNNILHLKEFKCFLKAEFPLHSRSLIFIVSHNFFVCLYVYSDPVTVGGGVVAQWVELRATLTLGASHGQPVRKEFPWRDQ